MHCRHDRPVRRMQMAKKVLVAGLGKSGISAVDFFSRQGAEVEAFDGKMVSDPQLMKRFPKAVFHFQENPTGEEEADLVVMSPGIPLDLPFVRRFSARGLEVTGDIEIAYRSSSSCAVAITGTNGKTTSTTLTGEIFRDFFPKVFVAGNIGNPILDELPNFDEETYVITELSSFQLESVKTYRPHIAAVLNITEDHLNRHKTMENYIAAKFRIFENQKADDFLVLNADDEILASQKLKTLSQIVFFSRKKELDRGVFVSEGKIVSTLSGEREEIMKLEEILLPGSHNLENILACTAISLLAGVDARTVQKRVSIFRGVEHRIEWVREVEGVGYWNDSKATNPDSAIKAVEAFEQPIILIAGGMDKKSDFTQWIKACKGKVKKMILFGETKEIIASRAEQLGFFEVRITENLKEAVQSAQKEAQSGDVVILSPACASWDMYPSFEVRGEEFKELVRNLQF